MLASMMTTNTGGTAVNANLTRYAPLYEGRLDIFNATETAVQTTYRTAGTLSRLYVRISANSVTASSTIRTRVNAGNGAQSVSVGSGATGDFEDDVNSDAVSAADEVNYQIVTGATGTSITWRVANVLFNVAGMASKRFGCTFNAALSASANTFNALPSQQADTTESFSQYDVKIPSTTKNLFVNITANSRSDSTTCRTRVNGGNGGLSVSIGSGVTGFVEDTSGSDALAVGDLINYQAVVGGGTGTITVSSIGLELQTTNNQYEIIGAASSGPSPENPSTTAFYYLGGALNNNATENLRQNRIRMTTMVASFAAYISANSIGNTSTYTFRVDGTDTAMTISIGAGVTGRLIDNVHSMALVSSNKIVAKLVTGAGGTSLATKAVSVLAQPRQAATLPLAGVGW